MSNLIDSIARLDRLAEDTEHSALLKTGEENVIEDLLAKLFEVRS